MQMFLGGTFTGFLLAVTMAAGALVTMNKQIDDATDRVARIELQYHDCKVIGDYPTNADMLPGESHE